MIKKCYIFILLVSVCCSHVMYAVYIPCHCGSGAQLTFISPVVSDLKKEAAANSTLSSFVSYARQMFEYWQAINQFKSDIFSIRDSFGYVQGIWNNFDLGEIANSWQIDSWQELSDLSTNYGKSFSKEELEAFKKDMLSSDTTKGQKSASALMSTLGFTTATLNDVNTSAKSYYEYLTGIKNDISYANVDNIMNAIMTQESRNATLKATTAATNSPSVSSAISEALGINTQNSTTVAEFKEKEATTEATKAVMWSDMANSINLQTKEKLDAVKLMIDTEKAAFEQKQFKDLLQ